MASRWRIRHKLSLGLGLVVVVMALLLSGTFRGLWSYYVTTNSIRAKLQEKEAAEQLKASIAKLVAPANLEKLLESRKTADDLRQVRNKLDGYEEKLQETLAGGHDQNDGVYERQVIEQLHKDLNGLERAIIDAPVAQAATMETTTQLENNGVTSLRAPVKKLLDTDGDLRKHINEQLEERWGQSRRHYQIALWIIVPSSIVGLLVMAGLMRSFYVWVFAPIRDLELGVGRVAGGDLGHRIELHSGDEMEDLGNAFNEMMGRLQDLYSDLARQVNERSRQLVRSERLASVGFLAAGVAHEINNPLASIAFCSEALEARLTDLLGGLDVSGRAGEEYEVFAKYLKMIQEEAFRCKNITERLLAFSRSSERKREATDLKELVQSVLDVTQHLQNHKGKHISFVTAAERARDGRILAWINAEEIKSVVLNLVVNALDSMVEDGQLTIKLSQRDDRAELRFTDTGCGMTQEVLENVFEPFFTRSRTGKGTGLGLTITHRIIEQHDGEIEASSPGPNQGSTFTVRLPLRPREGALPLPEAPRQAA